MPVRQIRRFAVPALLAALATAIVPRPSGADEPSPDPAHTTVITGRLLDADGKPVAGGQVVVMAEHWARYERPLGVYGHNNLPITFRPTGPVRTDREGRFRIDAPIGPARPSWNVLLHAAAEGHGMATLELAKGKPKQDFTIKLDREYAIRGRLLDTQGQPAAMALVRPILVAGLGTTLETLTSTDPPPYANPLIPAVSADDKGRFLIRGLRKDKVWIEITDERFATQRMHAQPTPMGELKESPFSLVGAKVVEGRVTYGKGGKPAAGARIVIVTGYDNVVQTRTDDEGRYALNPFPGDSFHLTVFPADGQPFLPWKKGLSFTQAARLEADVALERGVLVRGRVDEKPSGRPVAGALVVYRRRDPKTLGSRKWDWVHGVLETTVTATDGAFELAVPAGPGHLFVLGGTHDYVHVETSVGELEYGRPSIIRNYPDAVVPLDLKPDREPSVVFATLLRGATLRARVLGPDGKPAARFIALSKSYIPTGVELFQATWNALECRDGELILPGCDPEKGGTVYLYDSGRALGTTVVFSNGQVTGPPLTVTLQPCGSAKVRYVDCQGKPITSREPWVLIALTPGTVMAALYTSGKDDRELEGDWMLWANFAPKRSNEWRADAAGIVTIPALIPGAPYVIANDTKYDLTTGMARTEFRVKPGETLNLADIVTGK
jgi:hypothetical protein